MDKRNVFAIALLFLTSFNFFTFGQTKIYLTQNDFGVYEMVNSQDSALIYVSHREDMGAVYGAYYNFKDADERKEIIGKVEIYVDQKLELIGYFKDNLRDSIWTKYHSEVKDNDTLKHVETLSYKNGNLNGEKRFSQSNGTIEITNYKDGKLDGKYISYYPSGQIKYQGKIHQGMMLIRTSYHENGNFSLREYFSNTNQKVRNEYFNEDGKIYKILTHQVKRGLKEYDNLVLNGKIDIPFYKGKYEILFESNKIMVVQMFGEQGELLYSNSN